MKLKNKDLKDIAKKLNELAELEKDEQFDPNQDISELRQDLEAAVAGKGTDDGEPEIEITADDDFTEHEWNVLGELGCPAALEEESGDEEEEEEEETEEGDDDTEDEEGDDEEEAEEGVTYEDLEKMTKKKDLKTVIEEYELDIDPKQFKVDDLREEIAKALDLVESEEEEDDTEEEEEEETAEAPSYDEIMSMKKKDLKQVIEDHELDVDDSQKVADLRNSVVDALGLSEEEEEGEEEEEEETEENNAPSIEEIRSMKKKDLKTVVDEHELEVDTDLKLNDLREEVVADLHGEEEEEEEEEEAPEPPSYDDLQAMTKKKDLKQVVEDHELDVDDSQKVAELRESIATALGVAPKKSKGKKDSGKKSEGKKESKIKGIVNLILEESRTPGELVQAAEEKGLSPSSMRSAISHCKKEEQLKRYGMPEVIDKDEDGIIKLAKNCKKNKKSSSKGKSSGKTKSGSKKSKK